MTRTSSLSALLVSLFIGGCSWSNPNYKPGTEDEDTSSETAAPTEDTDPGETETPDPEDDTGTEPDPKPQCNDGIDNDGDGDIDGNDAGCTDSEDDDESDDPDPDPDPELERPFAPDGIWFTRPDLTNVTLHSVGSLLGPAFYVADRDVAYEYDCRLFSCESLPVYTPSADNSRCHGDSELSEISGYLSDLPFPVGEEVLVGIEGDESTPNNHISVVGEDGETGYEVNWAATCETPSGDKYVAGYSIRYGESTLDYTGDGLDPGGRGGSHLTTGVNVRGETLAQCDVSREDIELLDHAVFTLLWGGVLFYDESDSESPNHTRLSWSGDETAISRYLGTDPYLTMGSYLILDQDFDCDSNMQSIPGLLLCMGYQQFGGPVVDNSDTTGRFSFGVDQYARADVLSSCGFDLQGAYEGDSDYADDIQAILGQMNVIPEDELDEAFPGFVFPGDE